MLSFGFCAIRIGFLVYEALLLVFRFGLREFLAVWTGFYFEVLIQKFYLL